MHHIFHSYSIGISKINRSKYNYILDDERYNIASLTVIRNGFISKDFIHRS